MRDDKEMGDELWRLIFVNNGVKLAIEGPEVLEDLKAYESECLKILVCGTCLDHFDALEKNRLVKPPTCWISSRQCNWLMR